MSSILLVAIKLYNMTKTINNGFDFSDVVRDGRGGNAKHVGNDSIKGDITNSKHILIAVLLTGFAGNQLKTVPGILTQDTDILAWDKAARNKPDTEQVPNPFGILVVILVSFDGSDPFRVCDGDIDGIF